MICFKLISIHTPEMHLYDHEIELPFVVFGFIYLLMYGIIIYCAYQHPINHGNREVSVVLAIFVPFVYIIWRSLEKPLVCTGYNPCLSLFVGCCCTPFFVLTLLCEDERERYPIKYNLPDV